MSKKKKYIPLSLDPLATKAAVLAKYKTIARYVRRTNMCGGTTNMILNGKYPTSDHEKSIFQYTLRQLQQSGVLVQADGFADVT